MQSDQSQLAPILEAMNRALAPTYRVEKMLKTGGQGSVFLAYEDGRAVAIKLFKPDANAERLNREISLLSSLNHPNLVRLLNYGTMQILEATVAYVVYEFLSGGDLCQYASPDSRRLDARTLCAIGMQIGSVIETLWSRPERIVHRDVKPANVIEAEHGRFVLVDLGLARHIDLSDLTREGAGVGTPGYMSPEQEAGRRSLTIRADVFSLGVTLHELAMKVHPFNGEQELIRSTDPPNICTQRADLPERLGYLVKAMMRRVAVDRPGRVAHHFEDIIGDV